MLGSQIVALLDAMEQLFPTASWRCGDLAVWPIIRIALMARAYPGTSAPSARTGRWRRRLATALSAVADLGGHTGDDRRLDRIASRRPRHLLLLSDGISFVELGGRRYERCLGPLADLAADLGATSVLLVPRRVSGPHAHRWHPLAADLLLACAARAHVPIGDWPDLTAAMTWARGHGLDPPAPADLAMRIGRIMSMRRHFLGLLRAARPRLVAVTSFYEPVQMAMVGACRRLGITCVDVQHGLIGPGHAAYSGWTCAPGEGWELLPDLVWTWDATMADAIRRWSPMGRHGIIPGGNLLAEMFAAGEDPRVQPALGRARTMLRHAHRRILVTLQPDFDDGAYFARLLAVVAGSPTGWGFLLRTHPGHPPGTAARMAALFPPPRCDIHEAGTLPLPAVLAIADAHLTHSSSTVVEAAAAGLDSVVFDRLGAEAFAHVPGLQHAEDPPAIIAALARPARRRIGSDGGDRLDAARATLATLLAGRRP